MNQSHNNFVNLIRRLECRMDPDIQPGTYQKTQHNLRCLSINVQRMSKFTPLLLSAILLTTSISLYAQVSIGFRGGYTLSATQIREASGYKSNGLGSGSQLKNWHADFVINIPLYEMLYLQPVLRYVTKGAYLKPSETQQDAIVESANKIRLHYLEIPANLVLKIPFSAGKVVVGGGPYLAYGLAGSYNLDLLYNGRVVETNTQSVDFSSRDKGITPGLRLNRWDAGANAMVGVELGDMLMIGVNYSKGLLNLDRSKGSTIRNSYIGLSVGVLLNREDY